MHSKFWDPPQPQPPLKFIFCLPGKTKCESTWIKSNADIFEPSKPACRNYIYI